MPPTALILTVGTGNEQKLEDSILSPFRKTLHDVSWDRIVLLPSQTTIHIAELVRNDNPDLASRISVRPLPGAEDEYNLDRAFSHFEAELHSLFESDGSPENTTIDLTRGTKAMSAALALAAVSVGIHSIRYIEGGVKDHTGNTLAGTEHVSDITASTVSRSRTLSLSEQFLRNGQFAAARTTILSDPGLGQHSRYGPAAQWLSWAAKFWGDWDAFDYPGCECFLSRLSDTADCPSSLRDLIPSDEQCRLLSTLGLDNPPDPQSHLPLTRALVADLLANARRRFELNQNEETLVRIARVVELFGQIRLFEHGLDSSAIPIDHPKVAAWYQKQCAKGKHFDFRGEKTIALPRQRVGSLLKKLEDPMAKRLNTYDWLPNFDAELRNHSVLIHGFTARSRGLSSQIQDWLTRTEDFFSQEHPSNPALLAAARFPFFPNP